MVSVFIVEFQALISSDKSFKNRNIKHSPIGGCVGDKPRRYEGN